MTSKRLLIGLSSLIVMLTIAGGVSFVGYARRHAPNPWLAAVAPFDIYVLGLKSWRVRLAEGLTAQLDSMQPLDAVSQDVVRERWHGQSRPELAAVELARRTSAGVAIYGRVDSLANRSDSVRVQLIVVDAGTGQLLIAIDRPWPKHLGGLARALADRVSQNYRYPRD